MALCSMLECESHGQACMEVHSLRLKMEFLAAEQQSGYESSATNADINFLPFSYRQSHMAGQKAATFVVMIVKVRLC